MLKKWKNLTAAGVAVLMLGTVTSSAFAFEDLDGVPQAASILELRDEGIVGGIGNGKFDPRSPITARDAIVLIVRSLDLNLAAHTFIKAPQASDSFDNIPDDAWYADAFIIAHVNGVPIDRDIDPNGTVSREQFVRWLMSAVDAKGPHAWIEIYHLLEDEDDVSEGYMDYVQRAIIAKIAEPDDEGKFRPQAEITRGEAAEMARKAMRFVKETPAVEPLPADPIETGEVTPSVVSVTPEISKIILDMGERPHPGWGVKIESIEFIDEDSAVVHYSVTYPDPDAMYPMVITHPKAEQYIASAYTDISYALVQGNGSSSFPGAPEPGEVPPMPLPVPLPEKPDVPQPDAPANDPDHAVTP